MSLFMTYCENKFTSSEGSSGYRNLEKLAQVLGYSDSYQSALQSFFEDNPGAIEAVANWVEGQVDQNTEWQEALREEVGGEYCED